LNVVGQVGVPVEPGELAAQVNCLLGDRDRLGPPPHLRQQNSVVVQRGCQSGQVGVSVKPGQLAVQVNCLLGDRDRLGPPSHLRQPLSTGS